MGYFALVAYQNKDESYDVYTSHNGGEEFYLKPALDKVADGELDRTLTSIEAKKPWEEYSGMPEGVDPVSGTEKPISDSPKYRNIPKSRIPQITDFINVEALYLVHDDTVECYLPVWTYPNVLKALQEMYLLEVYGNEAIQEWQKTGTSPEKSDTEPIRNLKRSDFTPSSVQEPALRRYLERNHLSLFQTSTERQSDGSFTPTKGLFMMDEFTLTKPRATDWELDDDRGRGIFVRIPWDEGQGPLFLYHTRRYVESLRIDTSRTTVQSNTETTREELKMVGKLVKHFGNRVSKNAASPYDKYIDSFYESFGAEFTSDGDLYRVIDTPSEDTAGFRLRMLDEIVTPIKDLRSLDPEDVVIHTVKTGSDSEYDSLLKTLGRGDIIRAELSTTPDESSTFDSIELVKRFQVHFVTEDSVPDEIYDKYENKLKPELDRSDSDGQHLRSSLSVPDIEGAQIDIGEQIVVADGSSLDLWTETKSGRLSEEIYGGFLKHNDASPAEVIFVNPPSEPFWYGLIYEETPSPYATEIKRKLGISPQS